VLAKAIDVLDKYYTWLQSHNAATSGQVTYTQHSGQDFSGADLERVTGESVEELEERCNHDPACKGFTSIGWLKGEIADQDTWFSASHDLYVKEVPAGAHEALLQKSKTPEEPDTLTFAGGSEMEGQRGAGKEVLDMLRYILQQTEDERTTATSDEETAQGEFDTQIETFRTDETSLIENLQNFRTTLAETEKSLEQAVEDHTVTAKNLKAVKKYLAGIEPGCTFIQEQYESRKQSRDSERTALSGAIEHLQGTPAFAAAA